MKTLLLMLLTLAASAIAEEAPPRVNIFPKPSQVTDKSGEFQFSRSTVLDIGPGCESEARFLDDILMPGVGKLRTSPGGEPGNTVSFQLDSTQTDLGDEGYTLKVDPDKVSVVAAKPAGLFYAIQTIRQLLPPQIENPDAAKHASWKIPCVDIQDRPRFAWRGMMLDVSRHFFDKKAIEHFLDLEAMLKMNVFHWHLVDDCGWRIQIRKYPKLTSYGAWRKWSPALNAYDHLDFVGTSSGDRVYGGYCTQNDIREVVRYAAERHITVVPEIEMPGHSLAAMESYPDLTCEKSDGSHYTHAPGQQFPNVYCAGKEATFNFLEDVLDEVCELFPSEYVHIGGDEVDKVFWNNCPDCQKRMKDEGLKNGEELQSYFIRRIEKYLNSKGKRLIGWDEILEGGLAPNAAVMSWRGIQGGIAAAQSGHTVVMSPTSHCYFDYSYRDTSTEHVFTYEPVPQELTDDQKKFVIGAQCNLWTEIVPDVATAEERLFPRIIPLAEDVWSETKDPDVATFIARLEPFYSRLDALGINFYIPAPEAEFDAVLLNGTATVEFKRPLFAYSKIRYTLDGSMPTQKSPEYRGAITVDKPCVVTAALFRSGGAVSEPARVTVRTFQPPDSANLVPGLNWKLIEGQFNHVPNAGWAAPAATGNGSEIGLMGGKSENYAIRFEGFLKIDKEGVYTFGITSDDGSTLDIGGARVIDNDGLHPPAEKKGRIFLRKGLYPFAIGYFQAGGAQSLSATIAGPDLPQQPIPARLLFRTAG